MEERNREMEVLLESSPYKGCNDETGALYQDFLGEELDRDYQRRMNRLREEFREKKRRLSRGFSRRR